MFKNLRKKKKGFTLIELIIVIAIIAILAAVAIPRFGDVRNNAKIKSDVANAKSIANATTVLIGEGKITVPTTADLTINTTTATNPTTDEDKIESYLQNVPVPKSVSSTNFTVTIDSKGTVKVYAGSSATGTQFFPATTTQVD